MTRKPKELSEAPTLFRPTSDGQGGLALQASPRRPGPRGNVTGRGSGGFNETDDAGQLTALKDTTGVSRTELLTRRRAEDIARRLSVSRPLVDKRARRGIGDLASVAWHGGSDDIDLDATLDRIAGVAHPEDSDVMVREWVRSPRSVVLLVDVSGSMKGERIETAAAAVGALAGELSRDRLAVIAFWSDAAVLLPLGERLEPLAILGLLLRVPTGGLTNVSFALRSAAEQLTGAPEENRRVLLLSDCVHNAGPDPRIEASRLPRLDVLIDTSGEFDLELGRELARAGRGQCRRVHDHTDVAAALTAVFDPLN